ncbi:MAG: hypothetical protein JSU85_02365 [Candidatus Zixiibacteriota bacterium]|nr:MAG: hypothetical protein JSU85_02365 [candidate division Zixibacteria bacterium]
MAIKKCIEWASDSYTECAEYRDDGYNACSKYEKSCSDWLPWPLSYICDVFEWVCVAWYWVSNLVCVAWTTIVTIVCVAWELVAVIVAPIAILVELILSIPVIGRIIRELISIVAEIGWRIAGIVDAILDVAGIVFPKKLRICIVILKDEKGNPVSSESILQPFIDDAKKIYDDQARVLLLVEGIYEVDKPSPDYALDVHCDGGAWSDDLLMTGSYFERQMKRCALGGLGRLTGYAAPITVFAVRDVKNKKGCSLGPLSDYVTVEGKDPVCFAHEISHALGLWDVSKVDNLANPNCGGTKLKKWQRIIIRNSRHVTYI